MINRVFACDRTEKQTVMDGGDNGRPGQSHVHNNLFSLRERLALYVPAKKRSLIGVYLGFGVLY